MINVTSEIGKLKKVLIHRPAGELEHITPEYLARLLFDDIPFLDRAQKEHDAFANALRENGVEVVYLADLVSEAIDTQPYLKEVFIKDFLDASGNQAIGKRKELLRFFSDIEDTKTLVLKTMEGVLDSEVSAKKANPLASLSKAKGGFVLDPIPNLYFTRDVMASIGNGVSFNRMYSETRNRETVYYKYILENHPDFKNSVRTYYSPDMPYHIEGGDILNLTEKTIAVGISQRTTAEAIELLAKNLFEDPDSKIENVLAIDIPSMRAFMHLDTVLSQADKDAFMIHPGIVGNLRVFRVFPGAKGSVKAEALKGSLESILARYLEIDNVKLIKCGGNNSIAAQREQWNDGSNVLCIEPGKVIVYDRNIITNEILRDNGLKTVSIPSSELSRGRGGPRCMSMPLIRERF